MRSNGGSGGVPPFPPEYRASGLLLHVTSLLSPYGIGDLGSSAFSWVDRLHDAGQTWWQSLPLGPGSISIAITLGANEPRHLAANLLALLAAAIGSAIVALTIYSGMGLQRLAAVIGPAGINAIVKLSSFLLVCIGVQIVWNGMHQLLASALHPAIAR
jgi:hypothetical protein